MHHEALGEALPGDVGFSVKNVPVEDVRCNNVAKQQQKNGPSMEAAGFTAQVTIVNHLGQISDGHTFGLDCQRANTAASLLSLKTSLSFWYEAGRWP